MKVMTKGIIIIFALLLAAVGVFLFLGSEGPESDTMIIDHWQVAWAEELDTHMSQKDLENIEGWIDMDSSQKIPLKPDADTFQWIKFKIPQISENSTAILIDKIYARQIVVNMNGMRIYETQRQFNYNLNSVLIPITAEDSAQTVYIGVSSSTNKIGIFDPIKIGHYQQLMKDFIRENIADLVVGSTLIFIALIMLLCALFLKFVNMPMWFSISAIIFSCGLLILTYSPFVNWLFDYLTVGRLLLVLFDLSLFTMLPSLAFFFEQIFGAGYKSLIRRFRKYLFIYSLVCLLVLIVNELSDNRLYSLYSIVTVQILGYNMIILFIILACNSTIYVIKGNKEAAVFFGGFLLLALFSLIDLSQFYYHGGYYKLSLWKWGVVCFVASLITILGRRIAANHEQVVEYSKKLEMFNNELQRSEKMEIISELAASVAHEVRNPLQVTRGFLQLLVEKQQSSDKIYLSMALEELDRASAIITDFLTFAKPEGGKVTNLNVLSEFVHIEGILNPLANLQGGKISVQIPDNLYVRGNSSKFKQAFINIIKNSIEAIEGEGEIQIWSYEENGFVVIHIKDNGEGMDEEVLSRLGEPYFSRKTKGTGLGLMVTFRIIEVMNGEISFNSKKGSGTEVTIRFPFVEQEESGL